MDNYIAFLKNPTTSARDVEERYKKDPQCPRVSGHMLEDLLWSKNPHKHEIAQYLYESNRFVMAGRDVYLSILETTKSTP